MLFSPATNQPVTIQKIQFRNALVSLVSIPRLNKCSVTFAMTRKTWRWLVTVGFQRVTEVMDFWHDKELSRHFAEKATVVNADQAHGVDVVLVKIMPNTSLSRMQTHGYCTFPQVSISSHDQDIPQKIITVVTSEFNSLHELIWVEKFRQNCEGVQIFCNLKITIPNNSLLHWFFFQVWTFL